MAAAITEDRDPAFWRQVLGHPAVWPGVTLGRAFDIAAVVGDARVTPLRAAHGGYLFVQLDQLGRVQELHSLFTPDGWGREALLAGKAALHWMFDQGAQVITTFEIAGRRRSQPPLSFRFQPAGGFAPAPAFDASFRTWVLTRQAWEDSPAYRRSRSCPPPSSP